MATVALCNLGCSKNVVDGEVMIAHLEGLGLTYVENPADADIIVVNTCAFIQEAKEEAVETILEMSEYKKRGRCTTLAVAGCFSQRYGEDAKPLIPEVDIWLGLSGWKRVFARHFRRAAAGGRAVRHLTGLSASQYLKISDGCSHKCAFCAVPLIRGPFRSRSVASVLAEAKWLEQQGVKECILVSQDTSAYGRDRGTALVRLLERLLRETSLTWIRLMYLYPSGVNRELLRLVARERRICSYFDIPLQHIADPILKAMHRAPGSKAIRRLVEIIRTEVPDAALRTAFILGLPGETETHFRQLLDFVQWARFDKLGVFPFSPEEGTAAYAMPHRPRAGTARRRCETLMLAQREISRQRLESRVGTVLPVIVDRACSGSAGACEARTQWDAPEIDGTVFVRQSSSRPGQIISVRVTEAGDYDLYAEPA